MQEVKKESVTPAAVEAAARWVVIYLDGILYTVTGNWQWGLQTDAVFCSDVMAGWPQDFTGTKSLLHPEDKPIVTDLLQKLAMAESVGFRFRIITTYGEIKTLEGKEIRLAEPEEPVVFQPETSLMVQTQKGETTRHAAQEVLQQKSVFSFAERLSHQGVWYVNQSTGNTWFSDGMYRLLGLPPQGINVHPNTLYSFLHPDDHKTVTQAFEQSLDKTVPLHLQFRLVQAGGTEKWVEQTTAWDFNEGGETLLYGYVQDVSKTMEEERKCNDYEAALKIQRSLMQFAEGAAGMGYWQLNILTRKVTYSDAFYRLFGLKPGPAQNGLVAFAYLVHPDDREVYVEVQTKMWKEHTATEIDYRIVRPDGKTRYLRQKGKAFITGNEIVMAGTVQDVTVQKALEKKWSGAQQSAELKAVTTSQAERLAGVGSWYWNLQTGETEWSENFYDLLGQKPTSEALNQKALLRSIHPDDQKVFADAMELTLKEKRPGDFLFRLIRRGEVRHVKAAFRLLAQDANDYFVATLQDVTTEQEAVQALANNKALLEQLADAIPDQVMVTDAENDILLWNKKAEQVYGLRKEKALGQNFFDALPGLKKEAVLARLSQAMGGEEMWLPGEPGHYLLRGWFDMRYVPLYGEGSAVSGVLHLVRDVTEQRNLHQQLTTRLQFIERLLEVSVDRVVALDRNMNYLYWSRKAEEDFGLKKDDIIGKNILEVFPVTGQALSYTDFRTALYGETVYRPATEESKEEFYLIPVKDEAGEVTAVLWVQHDRSKDLLLKKQSQKAFDIINALNENYLELDRQYRVLFINKMALDYFERSEEEITGKVLWDVFPPLLDTSLHIAFVHAMEERIVVRREFASPQYGIALLVSIAPTADGIAVAFSDIGFIKEAEQKLAEEHRRLKEAQALGHVGSFEWVVGEEKTQWSEELYRINGMEPGDGEPASQDVHNFIHPEDRVAFEEKQTASLATAGRYGLVHRIVPADGQQRWVNHQWESIANDEGKIVRVRGVVQNITEQKATGHELKLQIAFAQTIVDASIDQITIFDKDERFLVWNKKAEEVGGLAKENVIGKTIGEVFPGIVNEPEFLAAQQKALAGEYVYIPAKRGLYSTAYQQWFYVPLKTEQGGTYAVLNIIHDISDKVEAEELLKQKAKELEAKSEEVTNFAFIASHDLKEPIRKIATFSNWLMDREADSLSIKAKEYVFKINTAVKRLDGLVEDITVLAQLQAIEPLPAEIDLNVVVTEAAAGLADRIEETNAVIESKNLPIITGDRKQLVHLFRNLIDNAIKFQQPDVMPVIEITCEKMSNPDGLPSGSYYQLCFTDNGIGFDVQYAEKIFRVFQRLHGQAQYPGSGIGLAICKKIMENHGGDIKAKSAPGKGSVFTCWFPCFI